jgi:NDP-sugar pyrophosphorylase family protein
MPPVAIVAGGLATRLHPTTLKIPKSMIEVAGKPFIYHQLSLLKRRGASDVLLCIGNLGSEIQDYVGDGKAWGLRVRYSYDGEKLLGTGGAIKKALDKLPDAFFVLYGDSYLDVDMEPILERFIGSGKQAIMTIYHNRNKLDKSNVVFKDGKILRYGKVQIPEMEYIDYGLSILSKRVFDAWPADTAFDLADVYGRLVNTGEMAAFEVSRRFYEIGSKSGINELERHMASVGMEC